MYRKLKIKSKKGALELSMNTIVIIVIGVTLLILGLAFVTGTFKKLQKMVDEFFNKPITPPTTFTKSLTLSPESTTLKKGEETTVHIYLFNTGETEAKNVKATATARAPKEDFICELYDTSAYNIKSGDNVDLKVLVQSQKEGTLGNKFCDFTVTGLGDNVKDSMLIKVEA